jgi:hypothetical protein
LAQEHIHAARNVDEKEKENNEEQKAFQSSVDLQLFHQLTTDRLIVFQ